MQKVASPFVRERGRVRVRVWLESPLESNSSPSSSPLLEGERWNKRRPSS